jgi:hypothetical protein
MLGDEAKLVEEVLDQLRQELGPNLPKGIVARVHANCHSGGRCSCVCSSLEVGSEVSDLVASMAPPFDQFFIEFQRAPNQQGLHAWGGA